MEINNISSVSKIYQTSGESRSPSPRLTGQKKGITTADILRKTSRTPDYTVTLSSKGRSRSASQFDRTQKNEKSFFDRKQQNQENQKTRELSNEKKSFESKQASEERTFEAQQRMEKQLFLQQQKRTNYR